MLFLHNILNGIWSMDRDYVANYLPLIASYLKGERTTDAISSSHSDQKQFSERNGISTMVLKNGNFQVSEYGSWSAPEDAPKNSIAIININGAITKYDQGCGPSGMATKSELAIRCADNSKTSVENIVNLTEGIPGEALLKALESDRGFLSSFKGELDSMKDLIVYHKKVTILLKIIQQKL